MTTKAKVVNKHHKVPYDVYIGRGSKWGNPFSHMNNTKAIYKVSSREIAIKCYEEWLWRQPNLLASLHELKGKTLACYCKPASCHGDVLVKLVNDLDNPNIFLGYCKNCFIPLDDNNVCLYCSRGN